MEYVIMCGGDYSDQFETPKPLIEICKEKLIERTIRLLKENGIERITITTNNISDYSYLGINIKRNEHRYVHEAKDLPKKSENAWLNAYYPFEKPACYLPGDVWWTEEAIKKIIYAPVKDVLFFASPGIYDGRKNANIKTHREPLGFKVLNQDKFRKAINEILEEIDKGKFTVDPVSWTLYKKLNGLKIDYHSWNNDIFDKPGELLVIDDMTTDIDNQENVKDLESMIYEKRVKEGEKGMVRCTPREYFTINEQMFNELKEVTRANAEANNKCELYIGDTFLCNEHIAKYLLNEEDKEGKPGNNPVDRPLVKVIEVIPDDEKLNKVYETAMKLKEDKPKRTRKKKVE